ncbi:hypothetical protein NXW50_30935 [Bacteroides thetaiotaomicron]|nr:hypothetical protein [Bacteroides thetaiotaomicron]MCS2282383.1 hypothetical protein [Bacteroides thetaiotaomicron]
MQRQGCLRVYVWLGMAVDDESIADLEDFSFYLDFPNLTESYEYLLLLPCTEWSVEGKTVSDGR